MTAPTQPATTDASTEAYIAAIAAIVAGAVGAAGMLAAFQSIATGGAAAWQAFVELLFREISLHRSKAAGVARNYVDQQRRLHNLPPVPVDLVGYNFKYFQASMEPIRQDVARWAAIDPKKSVETIQAFAAHEVEGANRQQVIAYVEAENDQPVPLDEPDRPKRPMRWARIGTGRENCAWCTMLISRGPVYSSAKAAGDSRKFHLYCDCKIVPVIDPANWPGKKQAADALAQWVSAGKKADKDIADPNVKTTNNVYRETLRVLRKRLTP